MRKIILVVDPNTGQKDLDKLLRIQTEIGKRCQVLYIFSSEPFQALSETLFAIGKAVGTDFMNAMVLYQGGEIFDHFKANMPCDHLDLNLFHLKLTEVTGGYETPQQKFIVDTLYMSGIVNLCRGE